MYFAVFAQVCFTFYCFEDEKLRVENSSRAGEPEVKKATGQQTVHKTYVLYSFALLIATVFVFEMHGVRHLVFRVHEGREQRNRVQKRVFSEKT